ncbi:MAG: hypothetical protein HY744_02540 [Deltaproteobacteria bacterium]|nr:hypothetical protein [Deltaproteobacteria bacterium]
MQWQPKLRRLFADGFGFGLGHTRRALARLLHLHGPLAGTDVARGVLLAWRAAALDPLGPDGVYAVERLLERELARATVQATARFATDATSATLPFAGRFPRPPPTDRLRN